jgi:hypothetical protein
MDKQELVRSSTEEQGSEDARLKEHVHKEAERLSGGRFHHPKSTLTEKQRIEYGQSAEKLNRENPPTADMMTAQEIRRAIQDLLRSINFADSIPDHQRTLLRLWCNNLARRLRRDGRQVGRPPSDPIEIIDWVNETEYPEREEGGKVAGSGKGGRKPKHDKKFWQLVQNTYDDLLAKDIGSKGAWNKAAETHGIKSGDAARIQCRRYLHPNTEQ